MKASIYCPTITGASTIDGSGRWIAGLDMSEDNGGTMHILYVSPDEMRSHAEQINALADELEAKQCATTD